VDGRAPDRPCEHRSQARTPLRGANSGVLVRALSYVRPLGGLQPTQNLTCRNRMPSLTQGQRPQPLVRRSRKLVEHLGVVLHPPPCSPSHQPGLVLMPATSNASSTERIGVIGDPELIPPPIAIYARLPSRPYASRPRRWVHRHLLDQSTNPARDEAMLMNRPLANGTVRQDATRSRQPRRSEGILASCITRRRIMNPGAMLLMIVVHNP
jgi:hypothetical protein